MTKKLPDSIGYPARPYSIPYRGSRDEIYDSGRHADENYTLNLSCVRILLTVARLNVERTKDISASGTNILMWWVCVSKREDELSVSLPIMNCLVVFSEFRYHVTDVVLCGGVQDLAEQECTCAAGGR